MRYLSLKTTTFISFVTKNTTPIAKITLISKDTFVAKNTFIAKNTMIHR
jgi:hypothetical protein